MKVKVWGLYWYEWSLGFRLRPSRSCGKCCSWTSCKCPCLFGCIVICSYACGKSTRCKTSATRRCNCSSTRQSRMCPVLLKLPTISLWWLRMFRLFDNTQLVSLSPNSWHFYDRLEWGSILAWWGPSLKISIDLLGTYIYLISIYIYYHSYNPIIHLSTYFHSLI